MKLGLYNEVELAPENEDVYWFIRRKGYLLSEVAKQLEMSTYDFYIWLSEPITDEDRRRIAIAVKRLFAIEVAELRDHIPNMEERKAQREHDKTKYETCSHCILNNGRRYTGQFRNYETGTNQWDG